MKTIRQIRKTPLLKRTVTEEYRLAKHEQRQPWCVFCGEELFLEQSRFNDVALAWDVRKGRFVEEEGEKGGLDMPACAHCHRETWEFVDDGTYMLTGKGIAMEKDSSRCG